MEERIKIATEQCVKVLLEHIVKKEGLSYEAANKKLQSTELYDCLMIPDTMLHLEDYWYLCRAYDLETEQGRSAMYRLFRNYSSLKPWERYLAEEEF